MSARVDLVTPAEPDQGVPGTTRARMKAAALGVVGALLVPLPAAAAPAPCEQALRYAAQSGAQLMRIGTLDLTPAGRTGRPVRDVGMGDVKSALVAQSTINSAALGRVLDGGPADRGAPAEVLQQTAPPSHDRPERRRRTAVTAGPFRLGASDLTVHARWDPRMACGDLPGEVTRAQAELRRAGVLENGGAALVRVPGKISGLSTTAMERRGPAARTVAAASMTGGTIEVLGGAITVKVLRPPSLLASMSGTDGGEVRYKPAVIEVSGEGLESARLDTAGDEVEVRLDENGEPVPEQDGTGPGGAVADRTAQDGAAPGSVGPVGGADDGDGQNGAAPRGATTGGAARSGANTGSAATRGAATGDTATGGAVNSGANTGDAARSGAGTGRAGTGGTVRDGAATSSAGGNNAATGNTAPRDTRWEGASKTATTPQGATNRSTTSDSPARSGGTASGGTATGGTATGGTAKGSRARNDAPKGSAATHGKGGTGTSHGPEHTGRSDGTPADEARTDKDSKPASSDKGDSRGPAGDTSGSPFAGLPTVGALAPAAPLTPPSLPAVPPLAGRTTETAPAAGPGTTVRIGLGDVRQAVSGHAIAAKATAVTIAITRGADRRAYGDGTTTATGLVLDLDMGLLEVAAVAPEPAGAVSGVADADAGAHGGGGGLPITGPRVDLMALTGVALLIGGAAALIFGLRGRPRP
ncbi:hypothetical protein [Actinoplanes nipponensis]|uniref:hypothetical protein n=1 Tax=Actinoplanes nipponensis TaxID=135950 RepID=UPI001943BBC8|nr:hypothetical protein [Actinoplanes nipponensis]